MMRVVKGKQFGFAGIEDRDDSKIEFNSLFLFNVCLD